MLPPRSGHPIRGISRPAAPIRSPWKEESSIKIRELTETLSSFDPEADVQIFLPEASTVINDDYYIECAYYGVASALPIAGGPDVILTIGEAQNF